jgi:plasmid stabilization system protein ParE
MCAKLDRFPRSGRSYDGRYRVLAVSKHLIFYCYDDTSDQVTIITILDGRRDIEDLLQDL